MNVRRSIRILGAVVYVVSFFCTAVYSDNLAVSGWLCTVATFAAFAEILRNPAEVVRSWYALGGAANPLLVLYTYLLHRADARAVRLIVAVAVLVLLPAATSVIVAMKLRFGIGHFLWVAGIAMIVGPEFSPERRDQPSI